MVVPSLGAHLAIDAAMESSAIRPVVLVVTREDVVAAADWHVCRRLVESRRSPVAVITSWLADDRRYRRLAFEIGVAAYVGRAVASREPDGG
jgi:hypothetical protein